MRIRIFLLIVLVVLFIAAGCSLSDAPAPAPAPTETSAPEPTSIPPTAVPIVSRPMDEIQIQSPGPSSEITSPVLVEGISGPTFEQTLIVKITDVNGTVLSMWATTIGADVGQAGPFSSSVMFNVDSDQPGRISVYDVSARDGGVVHLASVPVTLLASGVSNITASPPPEETIAIYSPSFLAEISGTELTVTGFSEYFFEANLSVTICGSGGGGGLHPICGKADNVIAEGYATIQSPEMGVPGSFSGMITYDVLPGTQARVVVFSSSMMDGGIEHLSSVEVVLGP